MNERRDNDIIDVDAEVMHDDGARSKAGADASSSWRAFSSEDRGTTGAYATDGGRVTFFTMSRLGAPGHQGLPQASTVTLILFFVCLFQWGFLAALGFAFFCTIGAALGIVYNMRRVMQGVLPNPWVWRIGNWCVSLLLVAWLAQ